MATKICAECGKKYESNYPKSKYCSNNCGHIAEMRKQRERYKKRTGKSLTEDSFPPSAPAKQERVCPICGNEISQKGQSKYCSSSCRYKAILKKQAEVRKKSPKHRRLSLCWDCQNACGGCSWSRSFEPVEGWEAKPSEDSFFVINCPQFIPDEVR
jgi:predicted nucleic acid-binding Zn ribbon protein